MNILVYRLCVWAHGCWFDWSLDETPDRLKVLRWQQEHEYVHGEVVAIFSRQIVLRR